MGFQVRTEKRENDLSLDRKIWVLEDGQGNGIEVWPALGFNCYRWYVNREGTHEVLHADPHFFQDNKPTRSGFPILFPFPNRIRAGRFTWEGKEYQLPLNDPAGKNAIHGFACRHPWRVVDHGANETSAWITGEFHGASEAPETLGLWPADYRLRITYRVERNKLSVQAKVDNPDRRPLPFGLGYHPYFLANFLGDKDSRVRVPAGSFWELEENLPTGRILPLDESRDLRAGKKIQDLTVDDVLTGLTQGQDLMLRGEMENEQGILTMRTSESFREMVIFTPPHRQAICLEPYTCTTDAINLEQRGIHAGWKALNPGETWQGLVELCLEA